MLATLIPLFNDNMEVSAYSLFAQKENKLLNPIYMGTGAFDGASHVDGIEIIDNIGLDKLSGERDVFVEINQFSIFTDISSECDAPNERIVLLIDTKILPEDAYVERIKALKEEGFRFAIHKLLISKFTQYDVILKQMDFLLVDHKKINIKTARGIISKAYPNMKLCAVNVNSKEDYEFLTQNDSFDLYEGEFFRTPIKKKGEEIAPLKITYIELLNIVNAPDFDLTDAADTISHDTALVISLLGMANRMSVNSEITSIRHAAAMIGQKELKKWINSAVTKELCVDKPSEITRMSLVRAKFAENLAKSFEMAQLDQELFLMGLFSVMDVILDEPMEDALQMVKVSKNISEALINHTGDLYAVLNFIMEYENASWQEVSRLIIMNDMDTDTVYRAYVEAVSWFKDLFN